jgi:hypothetical protein
MSNKNVKELVKNVIEENAVAFKATLNRTLYSKVGQKLQEKYVELSQNIFEIAGTAATEVSGVVNPSGFAAGSAATDVGLHPDPPMGPNGPVAKDYFQSPYSITRAPAREEFNNDEAYERALEIWHGQMNRFLRAVERYNRTRGL